MSQNLTFLLFLHNLQTTSAPIPRKDSNNLDWMQRQQHLVLMIDKHHHYHYPLVISSHYIIVYIHPYTISYPFYSPFLFWMKGMQVDHLPDFCQSKLQSHGGGLLHSRYGGYSSLVPENHKPESARFKRRRIRDSTYCVYELYTCICIYTHMCIWILYVYKDTLHEPY